MTGCGQAGSSLRSGGRKRPRSTYCFWFGSMRSMAPCSSRERRGGPVRRPHCVAEQYILVAQVQAAVGNDRVRPGRLLTAFGREEAATLDVLLLVRLNEEHGALLVARAARGASASPSLRSRAVHPGRASTGCRGQ